MLTTSHFHCSAYQQLPLTVFNVFSILFGNLGAKEAEEGQNNSLRLSKLSPMTA